MKRIVLTFALITSSIILKAQITDTGGNVGIGTTTPSSKLQTVVNNTGLNFVSTYINKSGVESGGNAVGIGFLNEVAVGAGWFKSGIVHERLGGYGIGTLHFLVNNSISPAVTTLADAKMSIKSNGNVGIGTTNPSTWFTGKVFQFENNRPIFSVKSSGDIGTLHFTNNKIASNHYGEFHVNHIYNSTSPNKSTLSFLTYPGGDLLSLQSDGKVGIGITEPVSKLDVKGDGVFRATDNTHGLALHIRNTNETNSFTLRGFTTKGQLKAQNGLPFEMEDQLGNTWFHGQNGGRVGIGTKAPSASLEVKGKTSSKLIMFDVKNQSPAWKDQIGINGDMDTPYGIAFSGKGHHRGGLYAENIGANADGNITLWSRASGSIVLQGHKVGIGTATPNAKLDVNGDILLKDNLKFKYAGKKIEYHGDANHRAHVQLYNSSNGNIEIENFWDAGNADIVLKPDHNVVVSNGNVGIGTTTTGSHKLAVEGSIGAREIKVEAFPNWSDFVFEKEYKLPTLKEVENHIKEKGHLKDIPSAVEVKKDGFYLGEMDAKLLQKIEELTLYTIQQEKEIQELKEQNKQLKDLAKEIALIKAKLK
ncbi:hypothetical protein [Tenacibaculum aiptasiae]|uniref:hypothetical protein n=1 Tax=Tenacibaculum aiptasiae TaxID=426481 RepID=UPI003B5BD949